MELSACAGAIHSHAYGGLGSHLEQGDLVLGRRSRLQLTHACMLHALVLFTICTRRPTCGCERDCGAERVDAG
jgi:hypothetical protein